MENQLATRNSQLATRNSQNKSENQLTTDNSQLTTRNSQLTTRNSQNIIPHQKMAFICIQFHEVVGKPFQSYTTIMFKPELYSSGSYRKYRLWYHLHSFIYLHFE